MAGEFNNYVLQQRPIQPLLDLGVVQNTLATITAGNKEALQKQSELRAAIANLDLNEAEEGYKQQLYDDITKTIDDNAIEGNAYYALDDIIKKQGDISSNEGLIGRVKAQQAYKTFRAQIDARNDIDQDTKDWAKELNPYHYRDKIDKEGRVIGGTEWLPEFTPTSSLDMNKIYQLASKYIVPKTTGINSSVFLNDDGTTSTNFDPNKNPVVLNTTTGHKTVVTSEMVRNAINMAIDANPDYAAQMHQAFKVEKWKHNKKPEVPNSAYDGTRELSFEEYKNNLINPFINSQLRNERIASTTWHTAAKSTSRGSSSNSGNGGASGEAVGLLNNTLGLNGETLFNIVGNGRHTSGLSINLPTRYLDSSVENVWQNGHAVAGLLGVPITKLPETYEGFIAMANGKPEYNMDFGKQLHMPTAMEAIEGSFAKGLSEETRQFLNLDPNVGKIRPADNSWTIRYPNAIRISPQQQAAVKDYYDLFGSQLASFKNPKTFTDDQIIDYIASVISTGSGIDSLDTSDPRIKQYVDNYNEVLNGIFAGEDSVTYNVKNGIDFSDVKRLRNLGMQVIGNRITLTKDNPDAAFAFIDYINKHLDPSNNFVLSEREEALQKKEEEMMMNSGGNYTGTLNAANFVDGNSLPSGYTYHNIAAYNKFFTEVLPEGKQNLRVKEVDEGMQDPTVLLNTQALNGLSVADYIGQQVLQMTGESKVKTMTNAAASEILDLARNRSLIDHDVFIAVDTGNGDYTYRLATRPEKIRICNELSAQDLNKVFGNLSYIDGFEFRPGLSYSRTNYELGATTDGDPQYIKKPEPESVNIILGDGIEDPLLNKLNNINYLQIGTELTNSWYTNSNITMGKVGSSPIVIKAAKSDDYKGEYNGTFDIYMGNDFYKRTDASEAINGVIAYRMMIDDRKDIPFTDDDSENSKLIGEYFGQHPDILNTMLSIYGDVDTVLTIANDIFLK